MLVNVYASEMPLVLTMSQMYVCRCKDNFFGLIMGENYKGYLCDQTWGMMRRVSFWSRMILLPT